MRGLALRVVLVVLGVAQLSSTDDRAFALLVADSIAEFSSIQGQDNWYYGYYDGLGGAPYSTTDFAELTEFGIGRTQWGQDGWYLPYPSWTTISSWGAHPTANREDANREDAVRRWESEVDGTIRIAGNFEQAGATGRVRGSIIVDGQGLWSGIIDGPNHTVPFSISAEVSRGSLIDFVVDAYGDDAADTTQFSATIRHLQTIYLNFDGNDGAGRADNMRAIIGSDDWTPEAFDVADDFGITGSQYTNQEMQTVVASRVADDFTRFDIEVVTDRPESGDYMEVFVGGRYENTGTAGTAQSVDTTNDDLNDSAIIFTDNMGQWLQNATVDMVDSPVFTTDEDTRWTTALVWLSNTTSHEIGHNLGLLHIENNTSPRDLMMQNWDASQRYSQNDSFQNSDLPLSHWESYAGMQQNSVARLAYEVGLGYQDPNVTPQAPVSLGSSLNVSLIDITMEDAVLLYTADVGFIDGIGQFVTTRMVELGQLSGDQDLSLFLGNSFFPIQVALIGKSSADGQFDLVFGNGFSRPSFTPFSSIDDVSMALLADPTLSTLEDLSMGFSGWDLLNSSPIQGGMIGEVVPVPEPSTVILLAIGACGLLAYCWRKRRAA